MTPAIDSQGSDNRTSSDVFDIGKLKIQESERKKFVKNKKRGHNFDFYQSK